MCLLTFPSPGSKLSGVSWWGAGGWEEASGRPSPEALSWACRHAQEGWDRESGLWGLLESWGRVGWALGAFTPGHLHDFTIASIPY